MADEEGREHEDDQETGAGRESEGLRKMLARYNDNAVGLAAELYTQTYVLRRKNRTLREQVKKLEQSAVPEGAVVLTGEQAKAWEAYQQLGEPEKVTKRLSEAEKSRRETAVLRAATKLGYNPKVLETLLGDAELEVEDSNGQPVFKVKQGETSKPLTEMVESDWAEFSNSLQDTKRGAGKAAVGQPGSREPGKADHVSAYLQAVQPAPKS